MSETMDDDLQTKKAIEDEFRLPIGPSTDGQRAVTGEPYVALCSGGIKPEGAEFPAWYPTPEAARGAYRKAFIDYAITAPNLSDGPITLYWREPPEMCMRTVYEVGHRSELVETVLYSIWSRLLVSGKPRMEQVA